MNNGKIELCNILTKDSPWNESAKAGWGRIDYNLRHCCDENNLLEYCKENLSRLELTNGRVAHVEWKQAYTLHDNRGYGCGVARPTHTKAIGSWRYAN